MDLNYNALRKLHYTRIHTLSCYFNKRIHVEALHMIFNYFLYVTVLLYENMKMLKKKKYNHMRVSISTRCERREN